MSDQADKKILELVKPEYMKKIPFFIRNHATTNTCRLIEREFNELYQQFELDEPSAEATEMMTKVVNDIFMERMKKHNML
ncbi:hypothetical protein EJ419_01835 [Alloscardovia theropitheci]|uniref:Uncharacterized protein n=1 Tax=Alloscardovia theropitheci TaxID=2496842 RepID=A0A4V6N6X1_9BIFI|nr:hypothetical protein [Alloscardovia theropitheci]TCD54859.1 hypothetical protein EJ419_01835 [Alloscardovia theropitheci]